MLFRLIGSVALLVLAFAPRPPAAGAQEDQVAVFRRAVEARNRGDLDALMAEFAPDAVRQDGSCQPPCVGAAALRRSFEQNIAEHFRADVLEAWAAGDTVVARAELRSDTFLARGAERVISNFTVELRGGKIARWSSIPDTSDAQTATYQAAVRAAAGQASPAPAELPRTGGPTGIPPDVLAAVGAATLAAGLGRRRRSRPPPATIERARHR